MLVEESSFADPSSKWRTTTTILVLLVLIALFAGIQLLLIFLIRPAYHRGTSWPVTLVGVLAAVLLITGYIPVPFEIQKRRGRVIGIDFGFLTIDWLGAFFSLMAIATQNTVDVLGVVMYTVWSVFPRPLLFPFFFLFSMYSISLSPLTPRTAAQQSKPASSSRMPSGSSAHAVSADEPKQPRRPGRISPKPRRGRKTECDSRTGCSGGMRMRTRNPTAVRARMVVREQITPVKPQEKVQERVKDHVRKYERFDGVELEKKRNFR